MKYIRTQTEGSKGCDVLTSGNKKWNAARDQNKRHECKIPLAFNGKENTSFAQSGENTNANKSAATDPERFPYQKNTIDQNDAVHNQCIHHK